MFQEPLNAPSRDQATLKASVMHGDSGVRHVLDSLDSGSCWKELQRNLSYLSSTSKRQLTLHAVELPFPQFSEFSGCVL